MGIFGRIFFGRIVPLVVVITAIFVGWVSMSPMAYGVIFATFGPLLEGRLPPVFFGHGKMVGTPPVPDDMMPQPRPKNELFRTLPGDYKMF